MGPYARLFDEAGLGYTISMTSIMQTIIPIIIVGYMIFILFRIFLERKLAKERKEYEALIEQKMKALEKDIHDRSRNLHDSIQMINHEYSKLMRDMSLKQREGMNQMMQTMKQRVKEPPKPFGMKPKKNTTQAFENSSDKPKKSDLGSSQSSTPEL